MTAGQEPAYDRRQSTGTGVAPWLVAALLVAVAALLLGYFRPLIPSPLHDPDAKPRVVAARGELAGDERATIELFQTSRDSVVHITSTRYQRDRFNRNVFQMEGAGTGFLWDSDGHIVTNYHVIDGAQGATVRLADGSTFDARFVGGERDKDIAVLKIDAGAKNLPPIVIGESADLQVGQKVFAIGNPFGLDQTLTTGVISGLGREIPAQNNPDGKMITDVIQTDAAINPGNSGGPLLDSAARLIGMNTAIYSPSGAYAGVGFAIPVDDINRIAPQIIRTGRAEQVGLGMSILADSIVRQFVEIEELPRQGVLVMQVMPDSAAAKAGLKPTRDSQQQIDWGDLIIAVDGKPVETSQDLFRIFERKEAGDTVQLTVLREGQTLIVEATLQVLPNFES